MPALPAEENRNVSMPRLIINCNLGLSFLLSTQVVFWHDYFYFYSSSFLHDYLYFYSSTQNKYLYHHCPYLPFILVVVHYIIIIVTSVTRGHMKTHTCPATPGNIATFFIHTVSECFCCFLYCQLNCVGLLFCLYTCTYIIERKTQLKFSCVSYDSTVLQYTYIYISLLIDTFLNYLNLTMYIMINIKLNLNYIKM